MASSAGASAKARMRAEIGEFCTRFGLAAPSVLNDDVFAVQYLDTQNLPIKCIVSTAFSLRYDTCHWCITHDDPAKLTVVYSGYDVRRAIHVLAGYIEDCQKHKRSS